MKRIAGIPIAVAVALALLVPAAAAHQVGPPGTYKSTVTSISPKTLPIKATMLFGGSDIRVENLGTKTLTLYDYSSPPRPYAQIGPHGVYVNHNSNSYFLNDDRYGNTAVPKGTGDGAPVFKRYSALPSFTYHDHRTHWMTKQLPPSVDNHDPTPQKVFDWKVPISYGDQKGQINGTLLYIGGKKPINWLETGGTIAALVLILGAFMFEARRRRARARVAGGDDTAADSTTPNEES